MRGRFEPQIALEHDERASLAQMAAMPGYKILHRLLRSQVDMFVISLVNVSAADPDDVLAAHQMAKAAAQFYDGITNVVNEEILAYTGAPRPGDKPIDSTEGILDLIALEGFLEEE